jgi:hypothetical protein
VGLQEYGIINPIMKNVTQQKNAAGVGRNLIQELFNFFHLPAGVMEIAEKNILAGYSIHKPLNK